MKWTDLTHVFIEEYKFNSDIAPDRDAVMNEQKAHRRILRIRSEVMSETASQVQLVLTKKENVMIFMISLSSTYYNRLICHRNASFAT